MTTDDYRNLLDWFANGETGLSSERIAFTAVGVKPARRWWTYDSPMDLGDTKRCVKLVELMGWREWFLTEFARPEHGPVWNAMVANWADVERMVAAGDARGVWQFLERHREAS